MNPLTEPGVHLTLLLIALLCLGLWIVTFKASRWRFELYAVDFSLGAFVFSLLVALVLGNVATDLPFNDRLLVSSKTSQALMIGAGMLFGMGNTLLLGASSLLGSAGAFGIAGGLALVAGLALSHSSTSSPSLLIAASLSAGSALLVAWACRRVDPKPAVPAKPQPLGPIQLRRSTRGIAVAVLSGLATAASYPLAMRGAFDDFGLGPYAGLLLFCIGSLGINIVLSLYFFNIALEGNAIPLKTYWRHWPGKHLPGLLGGALWAAGALATLMGRNTASGDSPALDSADYLPLGSIVIAMLLGVVIRREFAGPSRAAMPAMMVATLGIIASIVALATGLIAR